jgi:CheY-like chemotaxis protein
VLRGVGNSGQAARKLGICEATLYRKIDLILSDIAMPGETGARFWRGPRSATSLGRRVPALSEATRTRRIASARSVSASRWDNIRELRHVLALAGGRLTLIPLEFWPLDKINDVYERVTHGQVAGRVEITP